MKFLRTCAAASLLMFAACNTEQAPKVVAETTEAAAPAHEHATEIPLNNGQRWAINDEMRPFLAKSRQIFSDYRQQGGTDYKKLAQELEQENNQLIESCTMDGAAHEALHEWLHPHLELVEALGKAGSPEQANDILGKLATSFEQFDKYFQ